ncbi:MAG: apolipoprotein N-acyltransferase [Bifidobacteriaceae bacterium]|nr:apolipoprotein N-acyltransferase [Bifidobacteriaceae bacterium]
MSTPVSLPVRLAYVALAALAGALAYTAFPALNLWPAAPVAIALLMVALNRLGPAMGYLAATVFGLALFTPLLWWAAVAAGKVPWVILTIATSAMVGLVGLAWPLIRRLPPIAASPALSALAFAVLWAAVEELRAIAPLGGFPWGRLAFSQTSSPMADLAFLGGSPAVSLAAALAGALLPAVFTHLRGGRTWAACGVAALAAGLALGPGLIPLDQRAEAGSLRIAAVQGGGEGDVFPEGVTRGRAVLNLHSDVTAELLTQIGSNAIDLLIWPEDAVAFDLNHRPDVAKELGQIATAAGAPLLLGANEFPDGGGRYNVSLLIEPGGNIAGRYAKRHPVPFGEYIPWRSVARRVTDAVDRVRIDTLPGDEVGVVDVPVARTGTNVRVGEVICFEVVHDSLMRDTVQAGAELVVAQTNNASFGTSTESVQQLAMSRLRAIELGRTVVHISTTGVSAVISPAGIVLDEADAFTRATMVQTVPLRTTLTPAARYGGAIGWGIAALGAGLILTGLAAAIYRSRRKA